MSPDVLLSFCRSRWLCRVYISKRLMKHQSFFLEQLDTNYDL